MFSHKNVNVALAIFVFLASSIVYILTAGPTVALWDCGEYLAAAGCLGIPHPPGTPLLIPIARFFLMVFSFLKDPGFRLNLLAAFGSAATAMFVYLIIIRVMWYVVGEADTLWKRLTLYCSAECLIRHFLKSLENIRSYGESNGFQLILPWGAHITANRFTEQKSPE